MEDYPSTRQAHRPTQSEEEAAPEEYKIYIFQEITSSTTKHVVLFGNIVAITGYIAEWEHPRRDANINRFLVGGQWYRKDLQHMYY